MKKQRGWADRRGMGSESDSISEQFVPSERYKAQQLAIIETLLAGGLTREQVEALFPVQIGIPSIEKPKNC
jgi:hypothetical protein